MSEKQKVFISGPVSTRLETYKAEFAAAADLIERCGFIALNPATLPVGMDQGDYMRITLAMLETSDMVLMLDGWDHSDGAQLEAAYADYIEKPVLDMRHFRERYFTPEPEPEPVKRPLRRAERIFGSQDNWPTVPAPEPERTYPEGYKGFLLVRCPECGEIKGFCTKDYVTETTCRSCGEVIPLKDLIPAHVNCGKCGNHFKYRTNIMTQEPVPFNCLRCEAPVDLQLNTRGTALVTMGENSRGGVTDGNHFGNSYGTPEHWKEKREMRDGR